MADTLTTKKVTELTENTAMSDNDLFMVGSAGTASLRKLKWSNIWNTIKTAILGKLVANNLTTTAAGYLLDARQGKALDDKITELNTDLEACVGYDFKANGQYTVLNLSDYRWITVVTYNENYIINSITERISIFSNSDISIFSHFNDGTVRNSTVRKISDTSINVQLENTSGVHVYLHN